MELWPAFAAATEGRPREAGSGGEVAATGWPLGPKHLAPNPRESGNGGEVAGRPRRLSGRGPTRRVGAVGRQAGCG